MTDLKAANEALAKALAALDSPEHDADVREAEAIRNRLIELDGWIGARIEAKLNAHKAIADAWGFLDDHEGLALNRGAMLGTPSNPSQYAGTLTVGFGVMPEPDDLKTATSVLDRLYANLAKDEAAMNAKAAAVYGEPESQFTADAWQAHHEEHAGKYAMAGDEIPERVLNSEPSKPDFAKLAAMTDEEILARRAGDPNFTDSIDPDKCYLHPGVGVAEMQQAVVSDEQ